MATNVSQPVDYFNTVAGIDTISSSVKLGSTKLRDGQNTNYTPAGGYSTRNGYVKHNAATFNSGASWTGLYMARFSNSTNVAYGTCGNKLASDSTLSGTWTDSTNGLTITAGNNNLWSFAMLNDFVVGANDVDTCFQINSSSVAAVLGGSPPFTSALFPIEYNGYMFMCNTVESATRQSDRCRFSNLNDPNTWGANDYLDVGKKQGGDVRGGMVINGVLYVFKRQQINAIRYNPIPIGSTTIFPFTTSAVPVVKGVGAQSHRAMCTFTTPITNTVNPGQEVGFFIDQFGTPRLFDGNHTPVVGYPISQSRDTGIKCLTDMVKSRGPQYFAINYPARNQILCFMTQSGTTNDVCWVLDYSLGYAWGRFKFADVFNCGALFEGTNGVFQPYFGNYSGTVMKYDSGTNDNGSPINWYAVHADAYVGSPTTNSSWTQIEVRGQTGSTSQPVTIDFYKDAEDTPGVSTSIVLAKAQAMWDEVNWDEFNWAGSGPISATKEINTDAKTLRVKLSQSTLDYTAQIEGFTLDGRPLGKAQN